MKRTDLLVVVISKNQNTLKNNAWIAIKDVQSSNILVVGLTQLNRINETIVNSKSLSEILFVYEEQTMEQRDFSKILECLFSCERHGAVVSLNKCSQGVSRLTRGQYEKVSKYFSNYRVIPYIESLPALIKSEMFERFGLLDESFQTVTGALAEFSLRFNQYGWSTVRTNCWSDSGAFFGEITQCDKELLKKKYPYMSKIEEMYYMRQERAAEHFADVLIQEKDQNLKLLFSLYEVPPSYNGTANYALKLLEAFWNSYHEKYEISILVTRNADEFHGLSRKYPRVYYPETVRQHTFQLGYIASQVLCAEHMDIINRCCLKYSVCILDVICLRSHYLCKNDIGRFDLFRDSIEYADLMLSISKFSHDDIISFFNDEVQNANIKTGYIYLATDKRMSATTAGEIMGPFKDGDYFIVIGNAYKHKMIEPVLEVLKNIEENFVVIGTKIEGYVDKSRRIYGYVSGWLDGDSLNKMIEGSKCIIFPSVYEGFGLALYDAAIYQKQIIVSDTQINIELKRLLGEYSSRIITYRRLDELKKILSENSFGGSCEKKTFEIRNWQDAAKDLDKWIESMQEEEIDIFRLERRWKYLKRYWTENDYSKRKKSSARRERFIRECISRFPGVYKLYRRFVNAIDKEHYGSR